MPEQEGQQEKITAKPRIPKFRSLQEEAQFWETHSPLDYGGWKEVKQLNVARPLRHILGVRLDAKAIDRLAEIGERMGIGPSTLARIWIMERLNELEEQARGRTGRREMAQPDAPPPLQSS